MNTASGMVGALGCTSSGVRPWRKNLSAEPMNVQPAGIRRCSGDPELRSCMLAKPSFKQGGGRRVVGA